LSFVRTVVSKFSKVPIWPKRFFNGALSSEMSLDCCWGWLASGTGNINNGNNDGFYYESVNWLATLDISRGLDSASLLCMIIVTFYIFSLSQKKKKTPWSEFASELYQPSDRRLSAK
jgi:hypothetical protein